MYSVVLMMGMMTTGADQPKVVAVASAAKPSVKAAVASSGCTGSSAYAASSGCQGGEAYAAQGYRRMPRGGGRVRAVALLPVRVLFAPFARLRGCGG